MFIKRNHTKLLLIFTVIAMLSLGACGLKKTSGSDELSLNGSELSVRYIDVGQGDCELIMLPDGRNIVIDGGTGKTESELVAKIKSYGVEKLDYVIATHPHEDHIGGLDKVVESFEISNVCMPYVSASTRAFERFAAAVKESGAEVIEAKAGVKIIDEKNVKAEFIAPNSESYKSLNNYSAVLKFTYGTVTFLFTGDAEKESENEILSNGYNPKCDILKVGHHGSKTSTSPAFVSAANPKAAVIEVGKDNSYGHPSPSTLENLKDCSIYRTDENGTVTVVCDGKAFKIYTEK